VAAASRKTREEIAQLIAERFPRPDLPERFETLAPFPPVEDSPGNPEALFSTPSPTLGSTNEDSPGNSEALHPTPSPCSGPQHAPGHAASTALRGRMTPLAPRRVPFQFTGDQETGELYEDVRALMSHEIPSGEMALVFKRTLEIAKAQLAKRKFAATDRPGHSRGSGNPRHIPASVKRAVSERDERRCTFVSESGKRCDERGFLEYDHAEPVARGGKPTVDNVRLLCRAHNQHAAERAFGAEFMDKKRQDASQKATAARAPVPGARP